MSTSSSKTLRALALLVLLCAVLPGRTLAAPASDPTGEGLKPILTYISSAWDTLTRSMTDCASVVDPKINVAPVLYLPKDFA
jgi:alpha,alpha-trehalase